MPKKLTYEYVKSFIEKEGYVLLSHEYINSKTKLSIECDKNHKYKTNFSSFRAGCRCSKCFGTPKHTYDYVKNYIESFSYTLLSKEYMNNHQLLEMVCDKGHKLNIRFDNFKSGLRCPKCQGLKKYTFAEVFEYIEKHNYKMFTKKSKYKNVNSIIELECSVGHSYVTTFHNFKRGYRCPKCRFSGQEKEVLEYVKSIYSGIIVENDRLQLINPYSKHWLELDIWMPDIETAIEFNGYYHTLKEHHKRDLIKQSLCEKQGIRLLTVNSEEWCKRKESMKTLIYNYVVV